MDIVDQYLSAWNSHDSSAIEDCFLSDGIYIDSNLDMEITAHEFSLRADELFASFPKLKIVVEERSSNTSGLIATRWVIQGSVPGITLTGVDMLCIKQGKIQSVQVYFDRDTGRAFSKIPSLHLKYSPEAQPFIAINSVTFDPGKYHNSGLSTEEQVMIKKKLEKLIHGEQRFLDHELSLSALANELNISTNHLSQTINTEFQCNFYQYINEMRINFAKQLIKSDKAPKLKTLTISLDSGFKSTSTFYTAFKKITGATPSEFKAQLKYSDSVE
jgi:AraC-like DNA-binding protein